ncbi:alpha/beta hydrolase [Pseudomonas stutzeri]|uniref:Alkyl salicylate esterase n=1 Tax=Stutzerimonas stutzeri TaxID=316 RepID=A0A2N8S6A9_STUST|nr:alpha/beta fold hydrolase [Stutzerimonas stutzeri]MCQ4297664.1 alpha/beta hydrolase [Stutzerimonas stutzeri]PNF82164.1 alkyl salicylate esterase [Stutzerimonas stutzeri]
MADIVLIHGAWAGSWVWDSLQDGLRDAGHRPHAVDLPGNGHNDTPLTAASLQRYVEHVGALIETLPGPIQLVAHSGGGVTATAVAERYAERIAGVAYVAGMMLPSGMGFGELCAELSRDYPEVSGIGPYLEAVSGGSRVPSDAACAVFYHDAPAQAAIAAARRLTVQPDGGRDIAAYWSAERFGRLPRLYIEAAQDRSVLPRVQQRMQQLVPGAERVVLDCGHAPQLAMPDALLAALVDFFARHPHQVH